MRIRKGWEHWTQMQRKMWILEQSTNKWKAFVFDASPVQVMLRCAEVSASQYSLKKKNNKPVCDRQIDGLGDVGVRKGDW